MKVIFTEQQKKHYPHSFFSSGAPLPNPEVPERADRLLAAAVASGLMPEVPEDFGLEYISKVHTDRYLIYLKNIHRRWSRIEGGSSEVVPGIHPDRRDGGYPASAVGQAGWHHCDTASPVSADTWDSVLWSAHTAAHAANKVLFGERACYALSRPPGHHATREVASGFCYLNNAAIAAEVLRRKYDRVAILDVDVHHGNGTQEVFYERDDVLTVSIHADPVRFYPFFWGYAEEKGSGDGAGFNLNLPLPRGTADDDYLRTLDTAIDAIARFSSTAMVVALGLDAYEGDPLRGLAITTPGFARIGRRIGEIGLPTVLVQEGGYLSDELGDNAVYVGPYPGPGPKVRVSSPGGREPVWAPDGSALHYLAPDGTVVSVTIDYDGELRAGASRARTAAPTFVSPSLEETSYDVMPDGSLVVVRDDRTTQPEIRFVANWLEELKRLAPPED